MSGRKSAYEEQDCAAMLKDAFFKGISLSKISEIQEMLKLLDNPKTTVKNRKIKLFDLMLVRAIKNDKILIDLSKKILPDKIDDEKNPSPTLIQILEPIMRGDRKPQSPEEPPD